MGLAGFDVNWENVRRLLAMLADGNAVLAFSGPSLDGGGGPQNMQPNMCVGIGNFTQCIDYRIDSVPVTCSP